MNFLRKKQLFKNIVNFSDSNAFQSVFESINQMMNQFIYDHWIVLCIGTDRSTGDALGPLIGSKLKLLESNFFTVLGTLDSPVHALNLQEKIDFIQATYPTSGIISIDASLGKVSSVGTIQIIEGPLKPGAGVHKELPKVGDFHITGIVNVGGFMEYFVLQNTRLHLVMEIADIIYLSLSKAMRINKQKKENVISI